jgi:hypothetical protein
VRRGRESGVLAARCNVTKIFAHKQKYMSVDIYVSVREARRDETGVIEKGKFFSRREMDDLPIVIE